LVVEGRDEDDGLEREVMPLAIRNGGVRRLEVAGKGVDGVAGAWGL
jgi:hypothetical protein